MQLLQDGVLAALAAVGLVTLLLLPLSALSRRRCPGVLESAAVVPCRGGAEGLEYTVRALERVRAELGLRGPIVLLDRGMDEDAKHLAALLCRRNANIVILAAAELDKTL